MKQIRVLQKTCNDLETQRDALEDKVISAEALANHTLMEVETSATATKQGR